ncbi:hypothetical protein [Staphylococcus gallinarum]|uniref:hypothetical protein n=1 Tax=Staphylococcus gallinarum TaxID=1293 RepID=UPI001E55EEE0|nr:hypothetical protein [Staphylococcus gallinarum]MCD8845159.1 hypothetical protein [Staphylococcus gallinarum]
MIETQYNDSDVELELGYEGKVYLSYIPIYEFEEFLDGKYPNEDNSISIYATGKIDDKTFRTNTVKVEQNQGCLENI